MPGLKEHIRAGRGETLFRYPPNEGLRDFAEILEIANLQPIDTLADGSKALVMPTFMHDGNEENIVVTASMLNAGQPDKPKILFLPPYPFSARLTKNVFSGNSFTGWTQEGISPFESKFSMAAPYRSAEGAQHMYAGTIRMLQERIKDAHKNSQRVGVFGFSFGANVTSAYLNYIDTLHEDERTISLPDKVFVVEGGKIFESVIQATYGRKSDQDSIDAVKKNQELLPHQDTLPADMLERILAVVNPDDLSVSGQKEVWKGATMFEIRGTHARAPIKNLLQIRKRLRSHFQPLVNSPHSK